MYDATFTMADSAESLPQLPPETELKQDDGACGEQIRAPKLLVQDAGGGKGRGVFAVHSIARSTHVETSHVLVFDAQSYADHGRHTLLDDYTFKWADGSFALALGLGSLFNHARRPNVGWVRNFEARTIIYSALEDIPAGQELCISYGPSNGGCPSWWRKGRGALSGAPEDEDISGSSSSEEEQADAFLGRLVVDGS